MKKSLFMALAALLSWQAAFSQRADHVDIIEKSVTPKTDLTDKSQVEKMFWGYTNSPVEYYAAGIKAQGGLRLYKTWLERRWRLEAIPFQNYWIEIDEWERQTVDERNERKYTPTILRTSIVITDRLGDMLREKTRAMIDGYKAKAWRGDDGGICGFRCVVGGDVWSLYLWEPGGFAGQMSDLYNDIITDVSTNRNLDEDKYIAELESIGQ